MTALHPRLYDGGALLLVRKRGTEGWLGACVMISNRGTRTLAIDLRPGGPTILLVWVLTEGWVRMQDPAEVWEISVQETP